MAGRWIERRHGKISYGVLELGVDPRRYRAVAAVGPVAVAVEAETGNYQDSFGIRFMVWV